MTQIEWVKNPDNTTQGITVNSKTGCKNHTPEGLCLGGLFPCYAWRLAYTRLKQRYLEHANLAIPDGETHKHLYLKNEHYRDPFYPRFWEDRLKQPYQVKRPTGIFLDDMSDWMGDYWPEEWTQAELQMMRDNPQHRIYTLTKQPQNLIKFSPFPPNCYVGVSVTRNNQLENALKYLKQIEATVKFISFEPLLERINLDV